MSSRCARPRLIFANTVNELMLATPVCEHATALFAVAPRKLWLFEPGDLLVTPRRPSDSFIRYVCRVLGLERGVIRCCITSGGPTDLLALRVLASEELLQELSRFCCESSCAELLCYALDAPTLGLAHRLNLCPVGYSNGPDPKTQQTIYDLNTKSGFRRFAGEAGLLVPEGRTCSGVAELRAAVADLLRRFPKVRIKLDRSSNAHGQATIGAAGGVTDVDEALNRVLLACRKQPLNFVVEHGLDVSASPSIELTVGPDGVSTDYFCLQRYRADQFSGMLTAPESIDPAIRTAMTDAGLLLGEYLCLNGYRGVFDLDAAVTEEGELYFTEANVRRTAGTFVHELVLRLVGEDDYDDLVWIADSVSAPAAIPFDAGLDAISAHGLEYDPALRSGVLLTSDSIEVDHTWRYLVLAKNRLRAEQLEKDMVDLLSGLATSSQFALMHGGEQSDETAVISSAEAATPSNP